MEREGKGREGVAWEAGIHAHLLEFFPLPVYTAIVPWSFR